MALTPNEKGWLDLDYKPKYPANSQHHGIAIIGAGEIIEAAHLPAYQMAGFNVVGIYNRREERARRLADMFNIPTVYKTIEEIMADDRVTIVDIALPASIQPQIVEMAAAVGKHVLCQKPLGENYADAKKIVKLVEQGGIKGAINQQMRYAPGISASKSIINRGWMGELTQATVNVNVMQEFANWQFLREIDTLEVMYHSIHYLDSIRYMIGTPEAVFCDAARYPGQICKGETRTLIQLKYADSDLRATVHDNHNNWAPQDDWTATFRIEGTEGIIKGTNGSLYNYPVGKEDTISFISKQIDPTYWFTPQLEGKWFPHAFMGTMGELMLAIDENREPSNSVRDNLETLQIVFGAYKSMKEGRYITLKEIDEEVQ